MKRHLLLLIPFLSAIALSSPSLAAIDSKDIQKAAKLFCDTIKSGKTVAEANDVATDYITDKMSKNEKPNYAKTRQQMREAILKTCPDQAAKIRKSRGQ